MSNVAKMFLHGLLIALPLFFAGYDSRETRAQVSRQDSSPQPRVLHVGLLPEENIFLQKKRYKPLMDYLTEETGIAFKLRILPRYGNLIDNFNQIGLDAAFFGSFTGALAIKKLGVVPLARPQFIGGRSTYYGMIFVRKESGIKTAADMQGKRMVFVDRATTAGYLLPLDFFRKLHIENYSKWFREFYFSGTHESAIHEVLNGHADIGAAKNTVFYRMAAKDKRITQELEILATSPNVPANGLAVRKDLPDNLKDLLRHKLLTMHQSVKGSAILKAFGSEKFLLTTIKDYQPVIDYAANIGLDLATYNYYND